MTLSGSTDCRIVAKNPVNLCRSLWESCACWPIRLIPIGNPSSGWKWPGISLFKELRQLVLMREKPKTVEEALELAPRQLAAQKRLHRHLPEQHVHSLETQTEVEVEANALQRSEATAGSMQLEGLSRQVQLLSAELARLRTDSERRANARERSKPTRRAPVCWNCNERGHLRKDCPRRRPFNRTSQPHATYSTSSMATKLPLSPVVAANGEKLDVCGRSSVSLQVGGICTCYPVLVVRNV